METKKIQAAATGAQDVAIDWGALEDAFENTMHGVRSYLHRKSGAVLRVVDGVADPLTLTRIATDADYLRIEPVSSDEQYGWMEQFIETVADPELGGRLGQAIVGKGAFRRFKDVVMAHAAERERWFAFRGAELRRVMEAWLDEHAIRAVDRADPLARLRPAPAHHGGTAELSRRNLVEIADSLGPRDLEILTTFAEFLRARSPGGLA